MTGSTAPAAPAGSATGPARTAPRPGRPGRLPGFEGRMMAPGLLLLAALSIVPFLAIIVMSLARVRLLGGVGLHWVGADNWTRFFTDPDLGWAWIRTAVYFTLTVGLEMLAGVGLALAVRRLARGRNAALTLLLLPMFVAPVIVGLLGRFLTDSTFGLYTWMLRQIGYDGDIMGSKTSAFTAVVLMDVWEWTPLITLITLAGLTAIPASLREAAAIDGAGGWSMLAHIILPSISNVLLVALLIRSMDAIRYFDVIWVTTGGGPADATKTVPVRLYETAFRFFDLGYAAAIGLAMLAASIVVARAFIRVLDREGLTR